MFLKLDRRKTVSTLYVFSCGKATLRDVFSKYSVQGISSLGRRTASADSRICSGLLVEGLVELRSAPAKDGAVSLALMPDWVWRPTIRRCLSRDFPDEYHPIEPDPQIVARLG